MAGKVFISCGQATQEERKAANDIATWLKTQGFTAYVAIEAQSILDINAGIIGELKSSDYYLFINFRHEKVSGCDNEFYRGSLFTNQELAIAYALEFDKMLLINQKGTRREGMFAYIGSNTPEFNSLDETLPVIKTAVQKAKWNPSYSRNLVVSNPHWSKSNIFYRDHTGERNIKALYIEVCNKRSDVGAIDTVTRLSFITDQYGKENPSPDRSHLKCAGFPGYSQTIWPNSKVTFDLLALDINNQSQVFLSSAMDVRPRQPIITQKGRYVLKYEVFSQGFPPVQFLIELNLKENHNCTTAVLV